MILNEVVKSFLKQPDEVGKDKVSSTVQHDNVLVDLSANDTYPTTGSFFDDEQFQGGLFGKSEVSDVIFKQKEKIMKYRQLAMTPDVSDAIDEIVNEIIFSYDDQIPLKIDIDEENEKLVKAISDKFDKIMKLTNIRRNLFQIVKRGYIDGQIIMHCAYDEKSTKNGLKSIKMIEPTMLYFDVP